MGQNYWEIKILQNVNISVYKNNLRLKLLLTGTDVSFFFFNVLTCRFLITEIKNNLNSEWYD